MQNGIALVHLTLNPDCSSFLMYMGKPLTFLLTLQGYLFYPLFILT